MNTAFSRAGNNTLFIPNNDIGDHADFPAEGRSMEDIVAQVKHVLRNMSAFFALPELTYLRRGEKISGLKSWVRHGPRKG